ncbi:MAG: TonB family protein [Candidatus Cloacimonetes bacterium]|jgi:TonB family protein|nr:TonB family protein [Candidatus Cloacimonadota bacterium]
MSEKNIGILTSILFHLILIGIAILVHFSILPDSVYKRIEFIEFGFNESANNERFISPLSQSAKTSDTQDIGRMSNLIPKKVDLPKTFSKSEEPVYIPEHEETAFNQLDMNNKIGNSQTKIKSEVDENFINTSEISNPEDTAALTNDEYLNSLTNRLFGESESDSPYILEGEITNRRILNKVIPSYPEGVQQSVKVKIKFDVLPDGSVTNIIIIQKAEPKLEFSSLNAISKWKFNPISQDIVQKGVITFIYELK